MCTCRRRARPTTCTAVTGRATTSIRAASCVWTWRPAAASGTSRRSTTTSSTTTIRPPRFLATSRLTAGGSSAIVQVTKQSFAYVLDRVTGKPVWPIEERPVPASTVPGEKAAPTQPFPTKPPPFDRQGITVDDLIDFTPELRAEALAILKQYVTGPVFTPPSIASTEAGRHEGHHSGARLGRRRRLDRRGFRSRNRACSTCRR